MAEKKELQVQEKKEVAGQAERTSPVASFMPQTDIYETEEALTVVMEMPGVDRDDVDIQVDRGVLQVEGQVQFNRYEGLAPLYTEYNVGNFMRRFSLSNKIDQEKITASLDDGVLTLVLPKVEEAKPRKIAIA
jgi:HSP20 family protein